MRAGKIGDEKGAGERTGDRYLRVADDVDLGLEISTDLVVWTDGAAVFSNVTMEYLPAGGLRVTYGAPAASLPSGRIFVRLSGTLIP